MVVLVCFFRKSSVNILHFISEIAMDAYGTGEERIHAMRYRGYARMGERKFEGTISTPMEEI